MARTSGNDVCCGLAGRSLIDAGERLFANSVQSLNFQSGTSLEDNAKNGVPSTEVDSKLSQSEQKIVGKSE